MVHTAGNEQSQGLNAELLTVRYGSSLAEPRVLGPLPTAGRQIPAFTQSQCAENTRRLPVDASYAEVAKGVSASNHREIAETRVTLLP